MFLSIDFVRVTNCFYDYDYDYISIQRKIDLYFPVILLTDISLSPKITNAMLYRRRRRVCAR